jgi:hypothetical protein
MVGWQWNFTPFAAPTPLPSDRVAARQSCVPFDSLPSRARGILAHNNTGRASATVGSIRTLPKQMICTNE